jgi:hypothetical protein
MDAINQIEKHQKAIKVLDLIKCLNFRIASQQRMIETYKSFDNVSYCHLRINIDTKIKERLQKYYNNNFKI